MQSFMYSWLIDRHSKKVESLAIVYRVPMAFEMCSRGMLGCLSMCQKLSSLSLKMGDSAIPVIHLGVVLQNMKHLQRLSLTFAFRNDLDVSSLKGIILAGMRCQHWKLGAQMCMVDDSIMELFLEFAGTRNPMWQSLHLSLKHNQITDRGIQYLCQTMARAPQLKHVKINLSHNHSSPSRTMALMNMAALETCTLKMDGDVFQFSPFQMSSVTPQFLSKLKLSSAFCNPIIAPKLTMGGGRLRHLDMDFEGCHFDGDSLTQLVTCLREQLSLSLLSLSLQVLGSNVRRVDILHLLSDGVSHMTGLEQLTLAMNASDVWNDQVDGMMARLPVTLHRLRLEIGCVSEFRCFGLQNATSLQSLWIQLTGCQIHQIIFPKRLRTLTLDVSDGVVRTQVQPPPSIQYATLYLDHCNVKRGLALMGCTQLQHLKIQTQGLCTMQLFRILRMLSLCPENMRLKRLDLSIPSNNASLLALCISVVQRFAHTLTHLNLLLTMFQPNMETRMLCSAVSRLPHLLELGLTLSTHFGTSYCPAMCSEDAFQYLDQIARVTLNVQHLHIGCLLWKTLCC